MKVLLDSDVILDFFLGRELFYKNSTQIFKLCENKNIEGFTTPVIISNVFYILKKEYGNTFSLECIKDLIEIIDIVNISKNSIQQAIDSEFSDFEDALQSYSAEEYKMDCIITRNTKDYKNSKLKVMIPQDFIDFQNKR